MIEPIAWGDCICSIKRCMSIAECALDGLPVCLKCADELLDRINAIELDPRMRENLPDFSDH